MKKSILFAAVAVSLIALVSIAPKHVVGLLDSVVARTDAPQEINGTSYRIKGYVETDGEYQIYSYFEFGKTPELGSIIIVSKQTQSGPMHVDLFQLEPNTTYYYRTVVKTAEGTKYGELESFTTGAFFLSPLCTIGTVYNTLSGRIEKACLEQGVFANGGGNDTTDPHGGVDISLFNARTDDPQKINALSYRLKGHVDSDGVHEIVSYFEWGTTPELGMIALVPVQTQQGPIYANLHRLEPNTTYYYRTVLQTFGYNALYGETKSFTVGNVNTPETCTLQTVYNRVTGLLELACKEHQTSEDEDPDVEIAAENIDIAWDVGFLPNGRMLVTGRTGDLYEVDTEGTMRILPVENVEPEGDGLLGLAVDPNFESNNFIYLFIGEYDPEGMVERVARYRYEETSLIEDGIVIPNIPGGEEHVDGGRIAFGPDSKLYVTTGDHSLEGPSQDLTSLAGKILRVNPDGTIPDDNPFATATVSTSTSPANPLIYSYGHRNPQGLAWDDSGNMWSVEHGRSGSFSGYDEINLITPGGNYGWPEYEGDETAEGMIAPILHSGADTTWAPASLLYHNGKLYFTGLRGEALYEASLSGTTIGPVTAHFTNEYGRLRTVTLGPDGMLYITTGNRDGRGTVRENDDKVLRVDPTTL